ncbi:hypothetical protein GQ53DRAFT_815153 [Thozetella sp. PMI_491]|nr:hypothetical protein GQ53DRAFT_815153 [Thozetella sp. PMI_491]
MVLADAGAESSVPRDRRLSPTSSPTSPSAEYAAQIATGYLPVPERYSEAGRRRPSQVNHPSLYYNEFHLPNQNENVEPSELSNGPFLRPPSPGVVIHTAEGEQRPPEDGDYQRKPVSIAESDTTAPFAEVEFSSIKTIEDGGLSSWSPHFIPASASNSSTGSIPGAPSGTASKSDHTAAAPPVALHGIGGFVNELHVTDTASSEELARTLDQSIDLETIYDELHNAQEKSAFHQNQEYMPLDKLWSILSPPVIRRIIATLYQEKTTQEREYLTQQICGQELTSTGRRKILAVLIMVDRATSIDAFIAADILDLHLPLELISENKGKRLQFQLCKKGGERIPALESHCHRWRNTDFNSFKDLQSRMMAAFFDLPDDRIYYYNMSWEYRLPFTLYEHKNHGGYGRVYKVKIHRAHHNHKHQQASDREDQ